ncbi:MAG: FtsW/RodA/SpoVE family cell cycle protein [Fimbriimonadaceae bacterium]|nr:FtsW/RodA/SpoVE family cell cycle protein [Fimbriimonadaceae bacterium]
MISVRRLYDPLLFWLALALTGLGMLFIFDAGYARSLRDGKGMIPREFLMQIPFLVVGVAIALGLAGINQIKWKRWSKAVFWIGMLALLAVGIPGVGYEMSGAHRWIGRPPFLIQPAEFFKVAAILYLAGVFADRKPWPKKMPRFRDLAAKMDALAVPKLKRCLPALWVLIGVVLIEQEPDLGTAAVVMATGFAMFVLGGVSRTSLLIAVGLTLVGGFIMVKAQPYRMERILNHAQRWDKENVDDVSYQTVQSELAQATGGWIGVGIGAGRAKHLIPAATTDFISGTIGEEFGLLGSVMVIGLIGALVARLYWLASIAHTKFAALVLGGVGTWIGIQACTNIMMANGFIPAIGIPLPFISSGGSSLIALWMAIGLCQAVLKPVPVAKEAVVEVDRDRWGNRRTHLSRA